MKCLIACVFTILSMANCGGNRNVNISLSSDTILNVTDNPSSDLMDYFDEIPSVDIQPEDTLKI